MGPMMRIVKWEYDLSSIRFEGDNRIVVVGEFEVFKCPGRNIIGIPSLSIYTNGGIERKPYPTALSWSRRTPTGFLRTNIYDKDAIFILVLPP